MSLTWKSVRPVPAVPGWLGWLLRVPLLAKLVGANTLIALAAVLAELAAPAPDAAMLVLAALGISFVVNVALVAVALRPLRALELTAARVWRGDLEARVPASPLADPQLSRTGEALNLLLDRLGADRSRLRLLTAQVIGAQDEERARVARELHDSAAQSLAALVMQLAVLEREQDAPALATRVGTVRTMAADVLEEVRLLSHSLHPRVLDDLGLSAALEWLARRTREHEGVQVDVETQRNVSLVPQVPAAALYRVAQEALRNATQHAAPSRVQLRLDVNDASATLVVADDGRGFHVADAERRRPGMGLFSMRERVALVDGRLEVMSAPGRGTRVCATVPVRDGRVSSVRDE